MPSERMLGRARSTASARRVSASSICPTQIAPESSKAPVSCGSAGWSGRAILHELTLYRSACGCERPQMDVSPTRHDIARGKFPAPGVLDPSDEDVTVEARAELHPDAADHRTSLDFQPVSL